MKYVILLLFPLLLFFEFSCSPTEPDTGGGKGQDTTSHNFTWQKFTFGGAASSYLIDVAIINDTSIWAVGVIYINDSTGQVDPNAYNAVHWNGNEWKLKGIFFPTVCGQSSLTSYPSKAIFAFDDGQIWISSSGDKIGILKDDEQIDKFCLPSNVSLSINKIWVASSENLYAVGNNGNIAHYQNGSWSKLESGTDLNINDVWGITDKDGNELVLCAAYNFGTGGEKKLLKIKDNKVDTIQWVENRELYTVWFNSLDKIYAGGEGLFNRINSEWKEENLPALFKFKVGGPGLNDIWTAGGYGFAAHYNGATWKTFDEVKLSSGNYSGLAVKDNIVVMVGNEGNSAVITIGKNKLHS